MRDTLTTLELPYIEYKRQGKVPPHLLPALHLYLRAVRAGVGLSSNVSGKIARAALMVRLVDTDAEAAALEEVGVSVR